jgi:hypothetical protein
MLHARCHANLIHRGHCTTATACQQADRFVQTDRFYSAELVGWNMLPLIAAILTIWLCWPFIKLGIGTIAWLGDLYADVAECLPMLR